MDKGQEAIQQPMEDVVTRSGKPAFFKRMRWAYRMGFIAVIAITGIFITGFALFADHVSRMAPPSDPPSADGIIVLTGGHLRIKAAVDLLEAGKGQRLLISGVNPITTRDRLRLATGARKALFNCCVDIDIAALDTIGNADESAKWLERNGYDSIILVTNNYHIPRSMLELRRKVEKIAITAWPVVNSSLENGDWMTKPQAVRVLFTEYTKYLAAVMRGVLPVSDNTYGPVQNARAN